MKRADRPGRRDSPRGVRTGGVALRSEDRLENFPDVFGEDLLAFGGGVDAIGLIEAFDAADVFEQERDERGVVGFCDGGEDFCVFAGVGGAERFGHHHAGDENLGVRVFGADAVENGVEVGAGDGRFDAAKPVVGAEREHEDIDALAENPIDAAEPAGGGFAAEAGVDDAVGKIGGGEFFLKERGVGFGERFVEAVAGGEAVAEADDGLGGGSGGAGGGDHEGNEKEREEEECPRNTRKGAKRFLIWRGFACFAGGKKKSRSWVPTSRGRLLAAVRKKCV